MTHTVRLINDNALDGMEQIDTLVDCVLTVFNRDYFYDDTLEETLTNVACKMHHLLTGDGVVYIKVKVPDIPLISYVFTKCGFTLKNIITIPLLGGKVPCHPSKYIDDNIEYFLFFHKSDKCYRYLNPVEHDSNGCNCQFSANWSWFTGSMSDVYRTILKISTRHSEVILDPFMDAGDIGEAAILQDRNFIGIEISRARFDDTKRRLEELGE